MANTDKVFDDVEMLEGGSPADVGLDATRSDDELTLSEREELEALRAFKSYFDDCMVGQGYEIANFHMNGELEPFDNFYASAMEEHDKAIDRIAKTQPDIDFHNTVDSTAEIMTDDGKVNAMLYLTDAQYEAIVGRTDCESDLGASFAEMLHDDNTTMNVYVDIHLNMKVTMTLAVQSDTYGWKDYNVPLTADEKRILTDDVERAAGERYGLTLDEMIEEATASYLLREHPTPKIENVVTEPVSQSRVVAEFITSEDEECAILQNADGTFQNHYENGILHEVGFQTYAGAYDMLRCRKDEDVMMVSEQPEITQYSEHIIDIKPAESLKIDYDLGMIVSAETKEPLPPYTTTLVAGVDNGALLIREDEIPAATSYLKEIGIAVPTTNTVEVNGREETVWAFNPEKLAEINPSGTREYEKAAGITPEMRQQAVQSYKYWAGGEREEKQKERLLEPKKTKSSDERDDR